MVIQRSWKILSDAASTANNNNNNNNSTTSNNDAQQRSPAARQANSSSDDSDCSNQTSHSMDTRVASPIKPTATTSTTETPTLTLTMTMNGNGNGNEPALKYVTTSDMAETMLQRIRQRYNGVSNTESGGNAESAMRALELLRISVQQSFDAEVNDIIKRYMNSYFKPAFGNIKENLGQHAVNEETLQKMSSCALLENAKAQYTNFVVRQQRTVAANNAAATEQQRQALKRPAPLASTTGKMYTNNLGFAVAAGKPMPCTANMLSAQQQQQLQQVQQQQQQLQLQQQQLMQQLQQQQPQAFQLQNAAIMGGLLPTPVRRQIIWNTAQITTSTKFVLDVQANLAFGFSIDGKELGGPRLASKHPEIIRYLPDAEDREWLLVRGIIPNENRSTRFLFLIYDEVCRLQQTHELYRHKTSIDLNMMLTFTVTEPMIEKMMKFFVDLNIKSRGLITNSYIIANPQQLQQQQQQQQQSQQQPQQQQLQQQQQQSQQQQPQQQQQQQQQQQPQQQQQQPQQLQQLLLTGNSNNNSHLRNALLQGVSVQPNQLAIQQTTTTSTPTVEDTASKELPATAALPCLQGTVVGSSTTNQLKTKLLSSSSTLSSSHATLTALLNQQGGGAATLTPINNKFRNLS